MIYREKISGKTVRLRCIEERDAEVTYVMRSDPEKSKYIHAMEGTVEDQKNYIRRMREQLDNYLFVIENMDGRVIGMKGLYHYDPTERSVVSGQFLNFGSQIQSVEALLLSFKFAFYTLRVSKIYMSVLEDNQNMYDIQKKFGAVPYQRSSNTSFGCASIDSCLTLKAFQKSAPKIESRVGRFTNRR